MCGLKLTFRKLTNSLQDEIHHFLKYMSNSIINYKVVACPYNLPLLVFRFSCGALIQALNG